MIKTNYMSEITTTLAKKYGITEEAAKQNVDYILNRSVEIMEEPDTICFKLGKLGHIYTSIQLTRTAKNRRHKKKEIRTEKYNRLKAWIEGRNQKYNLRQRFRTIPRIYRRYFRLKKTNLELQTFQNEFKR